MQAISPQNQQNSSSTKEKPQYEPVSNIYQKILEEIANSTNYATTLASFQTEENYNSLSPKDRVNHRAFMASYLPIQEFSTEQKTSLLIHLILLADEPIVSLPSPNAVSAITTMEESSSSTRRSGRTPKHTADYQEFMEAQQSKKKVKEEPLQEVLQATTSSSSTGCTSPVPSTQPLDANFSPFFSSPGSDFLNSPGTEILNSPTANLSPEANPPNSGIKALLENTMSPGTKVEALSGAAISIDMFEKE